MYRHITIALDGSHNANPALIEAVRLAQLCKARLSLVHVVSVHDFAIENVGLLDSQALYDEARQQGSKILEEAGKLAESQGVQAVPVLLDAAEGGAALASVLVSYTQAENSDLLVIGTHGRKGWKHLLMGSFAEDVMRRTAVPLLVVRNPEDDDNPAVVTAG